MNRRRLLVLVVAGCVLTGLATTASAREYGRMSGDADIMAIMDAELDLAELGARFWTELNPGAWDEALYDLKGDAPTPGIKKLLADIDRIGKRLIVERIATNSRIREVVGFCDGVLARYMSDNRGPTSKEAKARCISLSRETQRRARAHNEAWDKSVTDIARRFEKELAGRTAAGYVEDARKKVFMLLMYFKVPTL